MTSAPTPSSATPGHGESHYPKDEDYDSSDGIYLHELFARLYRGLVPTLGFIALGAAIAAAIYLIVSPFASSTTSMRVTFAFVGYGKGEYPDHSKFQPDDVRAPDIIVKALTRQGLETNEDFQGKVRAALTIEGLIPPSVIKERDRIRAAGQTLAPYFPDEYLVTLTLPHKFPLNDRQREMLLDEIVTAYQERFQRTYTDIPVAFGNVFESLRAADFYEYEMVLNGEIQNIIAYLQQQLDQAKLFRSQSTNLSFSDLITQTQLFAQIRLYETLGFIRQNGLSRNRNIALVKMDYFLRTLKDQEQKAIEEQKVVDDLLAKSLERSQNYVLGIKSQAAQQRPETPILDQGLIDSLLANDAYNFLVHQALSTGLAVTNIQSQESQLLGRRKDMEAFLNRNAEDQSALFAQVEKTLGELETSYKELISNIRKTQADFSKQEFADAIRISMQPRMDSSYKQLAVASAIGGFIGIAFGIGLSLLGVYVGFKKE